jgi:hypothetical protein
VDTVGFVTLCFCLISTGLLALLSNLLVIYTLPILRLLVLPVGVDWFVELITSTRVELAELLVGKENKLLATLAKAVLNGSALPLVGILFALVNSCDM